MITREWVVSPPALPELSRNASRTSDEEIMLRATEALKSYGPIRRLLPDAHSSELVPTNPSSEKTIRLSVRNGVVILAGNVELHAYARMAASLVRRVTGVREVLNLLLADDELQTSVAAAIHHDPRIRELALRARVELGRVTLMGNVLDEGSRDVAKEVAAAVYGVRGVVDHLQPAH